MPVVYAFAALAGAGIAGLVFGPAGAIMGASVSVILLAIVVIHRA